MDFSRIFFLCFVFLRLFFSSWFSSKAQRLKFCLPKKFYILVALSSLADYKTLVTIFSFSVAFLNDDERRGADCLVKLVRSPPCRGPGREHHQRRSSQFLLINAVPRPPLGFFWFRTVPFPLFCPSPFAPVFVSRFRHSVPAPPVLRLAVRMSAS